MKTASFDRAVKFQFSSGDGSLMESVVEWVNSSCVGTTPVDCNGISGGTASDLMIVEFVIKHICMILFYTP